MAERERSWVAESLLIVVSILVAFAIDAWWQERQERVEERRILASLRAEFQANAERLPLFIGSHQLVADYAAELLAGLRAAGPGGGVTIEDSRLTWLLSHNSTDPQRGALDAILQSGELRYIRSQEVRERLSGWPRLVTDATENEDLLRKTWNPLFLAALAQRVDLLPVEGLDPRCREDFQAAVCALEATEFPYDPKLIGLLIPIRGYSAEAAKELGVLEAEARDIVALLDAELAALDE